jgi:hypothetical protein
MVNRYCVRSRAAATANTANPIVCANAACITALLALPAILPLTEQNAAIRQAVRHPRTSFAA